MKHFFFSLFLMLFAGTMSCQAYSKQLIKANKALLALEKNANASLKDHQIVVDQLSAVINTTKDIDDKCEASLELAEAYSVHVPVQFRDYAKAADYYKKALELICENYNSDADDERETVKKLKYRAFYNTAYYCYYKNSPTQDLGKALDYFVEAAEYNPSAVVVAHYLHLRHIVRRDVPRRQVVLAAQQVHALDVELRDGLAHVADAAVLRHVHARQPLQSVLQRHVALAQERRQVMA